MQALISGERSVKMVDWANKKTGRLFLTMIILSFIGVGSSVSAQAKMQNKETCKALKSEQAEFLGSGILDDMSRGPDWVKDNLEPEQVERVKRYLTLDATLAFQCPGGGPAIKSKKKPKATGTRAKKKIIRKKRVRKKKKTSSLSLAFQPF